MGDSAKVGSAIKNTLSDSFKADWNPSDEQTIRDIRNHCHFPESILGLDKKYFTSLTISDFSHLKLVVVEWKESSFVGLHSDGLFVPLDAQGKWEQKISPLLPFLEKASIDGQYSKDGGEESPTETGEKRSADVSGWPQSSDSTLEGAEASPSVDLITKLNGFLKKISPSAIDPNTNSQPTGFICPLVAEPPPFVMDSAWEIEADQAPIIKNAAAELYKSDSVSVKHWAIPFYSDHFLFQVARFVEDQVALLYGVADKTGYVTSFIDGTSPHIHELNASVPLEINDSNVALYLEFFCWAVHGEKGSFMIPRNVQIAGLYKDVSSQTREEMVRMLDLSPSIPAADGGHSDEGDWSFKEVPILYNRTLFKAIMSVNQKGPVSMLDDQPGESDLPTLTFIVSEEDKKQCRALREYIRGEDSENKRDTAASEPLDSALEGLRGGHTVQRLIRFLRESEKLEKKLKEITRSETKSSQQN